jgi:hypothetical protein
VSRGQGYAVDVDIHIHCKFRRERIYFRWSPIEATSIPVSYFVLGYRIRNVNRAIKKWFIKAAEFCTCFPNHLWGRLNSFSAMSHIPHKTIIYTIHSHFPHLLENTLSPIIQRLPFCANRNYISNSSI